MNAPQESGGGGVRAWAAYLRALGSSPAPTHGPDTPVKAHRWGFGAFLLAQLVFLLVSVFLAAIFRPVGGEPLSHAGLVLTLSVPIVLAAGVGIAATRLRGNGPLVDLRIEWRWSDVVLGLTIGVVSLVPTLIASSLWTKWMGKDEASSAVGNVLDGVHLSPTVAVLVFLHLWLIAPICEEILYRGLVWGAAERLGWSRWAAFAVSTSIFAVAHLEPARTPLLLVIAIPIGLARLITGRLLASIVAHQVNNLLPALGLLLTVLGVMPA
ncbi:CPBP family intramembrane glutamic endopeptidase [Allokutzneria albata]|uniref:CAAX prenyl protease 2/Lysostaphin resistance protein A-like domain-containing protein n=1 Tax=Allokutzneria albata TaxID=211114 RepID=A0A1G9XDJ3_ALLAB|nr:type II CAAX endopeptidase family protein [Allokutzneria albata]SDM94794.1 hypothetical protein SAMN04489726_4142 [Allokutzneria albata]